MSVKFAQLCNPSMYTDMHVDTPGQSAVYLTTQDILNQ